MTRVMVALLLLASVGPVLAQSRRARLEWTRTLEDDGNIVLAAWSPTGSCVAVATETTVHVISSSGQLLWTWNFRETNRFIHVPPFSGPFAVSTTCDVVVIGGDPGYKYLWSANQRGQHRFLATDGTPLSARFSLRGDTLALITGGGSGYLLSPGLDVRWRGAIRDLPVRWPSQVVSNPVDPGHDVEFSRQDVDTLFGAMLWGWGVSDSVSDDGQWRVFTQGQERGRRTTTIELWGPGAGGYRGRLRKWNDPDRPRWVKPMGCPGAELTRDGAFVIAEGDPEHTDAYGVGDSPVCDSLQLPTYVFDRDGNLVLTWPAEKSRSDMAAAFLEAAGVPLALQDDSVWLQRPNWNVPSTVDEIHDAQFPDSKTPRPVRYELYSPDNRRALVGRGREVRVYSAPERLPRR